MHANEEELELILADWEPWRAAGEAIDESFVLDGGPTESGVRVVECFGTPDEFVSVFVGGLFEADVEACLASSLTVEERFDVLLEGRPRFSSGWTDLLEACGWVDPGQ